MIDKSHYHQYTTTTTKNNKKKIIQNDDEEDESPSKSEDLEENYQLELVNVYDKSFPANQDKSLASEMKLDQTEVVDMTKSVRLQIDWLMLRLIWLYLANWPCLE